MLIVPPAAPSCSAVGERTTSIRSIRSAGISSSGSWASLRDALTATPSIKIRVFCGPMPRMRISSPPVAVVEVCTPGNCRMMSATEFAPMASISCRPTVTVGEVVAKRSSKLRRLRTITVFCSPAVGSPGGDCARNEYGSNAHSEKKLQNNRAQLPQRCAATAASISDYRRRRPGHKTWRNADDSAPPSHWPAPGSGLTQTVCHTAARCRPAPPAWPRPCV